MNNRQKRTLMAVFTDPAPANIHWADIENVLGALGAYMEEGRGSRVRVELSDVRATFHRPHPEREASRPQVRSVRQFLEQAGIDPADIE